MAKILVIDDDTAVRNVVGLLLIQAGYDVVDAEYGQIGYSKAQSEAPDLILLDLMMPVVDGFEVLRRLKSNPSTECIPVIILTAKIDAASERECMRSGAVDYIKKPWGPRELEERIGMALGYPELSRPPELPDNEPTIDAGVENSENPELSQPRRFRTRSFRIQHGGEYQENPNFIPAEDLPADESPNAGDDGEPASMGIVQPRQFRTRRFRIRRDGVDPASLI